MIRELVSRVSRTLTERRVSPRKKYHMPVKVCFAPEKNAANLRRTSCDDLFLSGETTDLSETGIGFLVSTIRIKEKYLVGQERLLNVELDLPGAKIRMQIRGVRYEKVGIHISTEKYFVGAEIIKIDEEDKATYEYFLENRGQIRRTAATCLELGVE
ncbi:MAG: PilZ domain-containing protein [Blastocatellia bacterium]|nr:PilZ domain-containing protein [Blastocatellia bacterium]MDQ3221788.1 PilZ domain-containing protein [Acidobacteriota bacterium]